MEQIERFIRTLTQSEEQYDALYQLWYTCQKNALQSQPQPPTLVSCPILMQAGKRKGQPCQKPCKPNQTQCASHEGMTMCSQTQCSRTCEHGKEMCLFHRREIEHMRELEKPVVSIRFHGTYYLINKTNVLIDPMYNTLLGYVDELNQVHYEKNTDVDRVSELYQLRFTGR